MRPLLTHERWVKPEVHKGHVEDETPHDEECSVEELKLWVVYDGGQDQVYGGHQHQDGDHQGHL